QRLNDINYLVFEDNLSFDPKPRISHIEEVSIRNGSFYDTLKNVKAIYETEIAKNNSKGIIAGNRIQQIIIDQYRNNWELFKKAMKDMVKLYNSSTDIVDLCINFIGIVKTELSILLVRGDFFEIKTRIKRRKGKKKVLRICKQI